jgi:hypothetical protein
MEGEKKSFDFRTKRYLRGKGSVIFPPSFLSNRVLHTKTNWAVQR